jgi:hypothetical protein
MNHVKHRFRARQIELAVVERPPRELPRRREPCSAREHLGQHAFHVVRAAVAVQLRDILARERAWRPHRERQHAIESHAFAIAEPRDTHFARQICVRDADRVGNDRDRARTTDAHDPYAAHT